MLDKDKNEKKRSESEARLMLATPRAQIDTMLALQVKDFIASTHRRLNALEGQIKLYESSTLHTGDTLYIARLRSDLAELRESLRLTLSTGPAADRRHRDEDHFTTLFGREAPKG